MLVAPTDFSSISDGVQVLNLLQEKIPDEKTQLVWSTDAQEAVHEHALIILPTNPTIKGSFFKQLLV